MFIYVYLIYCIASPCPEVVASNPLWFHHQDACQKKQKKQHNSGTLDPVELNMA